MQAEIKNTSVNLDGLLEVLGKNLYSTASVAIRELIQNAHDACERHRIEHGEKEFEIELSCDLEQNILTITDNGSGLTKQEINDYLATIGSGYTRVLRNQNDPGSMIGYFGLGFLSAYVVSDKVEVWTSSYKEPSKAWYFTSLGGKTFTISESTSRPIGTTVKLHINKKFAYLSDQSTVQGLLEQYCCLLPIPIRFTNTQSAINQFEKPWGHDFSQNPIQRKRKQLEFAALFENNFEPITCLAIPDDNPLDLHGIVWIQNGGSYANSDNRNVNVFIRSMFISDKEKELLPSWAGFCGGVFESIHFQPTASRETLQSNDYYKEVQKYLHEFIVSSLREVVLNEPAAWKLILRLHNESLLGAAVTDKRLFDVMSTSLKVPTISGEMNINQILRSSNDTLYVKNAIENSYDDIIFKAKKIPVVLGYRFAASEFCRQYSINNGIDLKRVGFKDSEKTIFADTEINDHDKDYLVTLFEQPNQQIHFSEYEPSSLPLAIVEDQEIKLKQRIENEENEKRISSAALALARLHTKKISNEITSHLYLNLSNPVIKLILKQRSKKSEYTSKLLYSMVSSMNIGNDTTDGDNSRNGIDHLEKINIELSKLLEAS